MALIVVGDIHHTNKSPKFEQAEKILNFIFKFANENDSLFLLGDLVENMDSPHEILERFIDLFLNVSKYKHIYILQGNHDASMESSFLSAFKPLPKVSIIQEPTILTIEENKILALPYYYHEGTDKIPIIKNYSEVLPTLPQFTEKFDFVFHHVEDETKHFNDKYCDLSWINAQQFLCGHIHLCNIQEGGRFLGSVTLNSSAEKGKTPYIAKIENKKHTLIPAPKYLEYKSVDYPNDLPETETEYTLWTITNSLDRQESIDFYTRKAKEKGQSFYIRKVIGKDFQKFVLDTNIKEKSNTEDVSFSEFFNIYSNSSKLDTSVTEICRQIIQKKEKGV